MDIILGFVSSTALVFNLGAYLLPSNFSRPFTNIIGLVPQYADAPSLDITFNGRCYADSIRISCVDTMLEIAQNQVTGYEAPEALLWTSEWFLKMLKPLNASYMICKSCRSSIIQGREVADNSPWLTIGLMLRAFDL
jgi:hypothetical protein